jgi:hypothetical protein
MSEIQAPIATIVDLFEQRDRRIAALEAEKAAYADRLTELEDRLINMLQQRVALLEEKMGLEERLAEMAAYEAAKAEKAAAYEAAKAAKAEKVAAKAAKAEKAAAKAAEKAAAHEAEKAAAYEAEKAARAAARAAVRSAAKEAKSAAVNALKAVVLGNPAPTAADYRLSAGAIDHTTCVGRDLDDRQDYRWSPAVYIEGQCGKAVHDGGLCKKCITRHEKYVADASYYLWNGRVTEEPIARCHMLGTAWAARTKPVFH